MHLKRISSSAYAWGMSGASVFLVVLAAGVPASAQEVKQTGDILVFTNGDRLTGKLERSVKGSIVFKSDLAGEITVPIEKIKDLKTEGTFAVLLHGAPVKNSQQVKPVQIDIMDSQVQLLPENAPLPAPIPAAQVAYIIDSATFHKELDHNPGFFQGWNGSANLGATFLQATQHGGTLTAGVALARQVPTLRYFRARNRTLLNVLETYGTMTTPAIPPTNPATPDSTVKTSIFHADFERDEYISKRTYYFGLASWDHNFAQGLDLQQIYGGGVGFTPFSTDLHQLDLKADIHYEKQEFFDSSTNQNLVGSTFGEAYRRTLPRKIAFTQTAAFIESWNNTNAYAANGSIGLTLPVIRRFSLFVTAADDFINNPSPFYKKNSFTFATGLSYAFR